MTTCTIIKALSAPCCRCGVFSEPVHVVGTPEAAEFYCADDCPACNEKARAEGV